MLWKSICILFIINTFSSISKATLIPERNDTNLNISISCQLSELKAEVKRLKKDAVDKETTIKSLRLELEEQKKCGVETTNQLVKAEVARQGKLIDELFKDRQEKLIDGLVKATDIKFLREELERLKNDGLDKESHLQSLRTEQERQGTLIEGLVTKWDRLESCISPQNCAEAKSSGIFLLSNISSQPFNVTCDTKTRGGRWTVILRRMDGSIEFNRNWTEYKTGFGDLNGEFFLGLDKIHQLTAKGSHELLVLLEDFEGDERFETYEEFGIGNEDQQYVLHTLGKANGTAGDSFSRHMGMKFSTFDRDNDLNSAVHCAEKYIGGWWYHEGCHKSKLTGIYKDYTFGIGINWNDFHGFSYSLKRAVMMIRLKK